jgi:hypothetical protein
VRLSCYALSPIEYDLITEDDLKKIKIIVITTFLLFTLRAHADDFKVFDLEYSMPIDTPWLRIITNHVDWLNFYFELLAAQGIDPAKYCDPNSEVPVECSPPAPLVNYKNHQIVVGGLGIRYTGGSKIVVSAVDSTATDMLRIDVIDLNPNTDCFTTQVINHPMTVVAVPKSEKPIRVLVKDAALYCVN